MAIEVSRAYNEVGHIEGKETFTIETARVSLWQHESISQVLTIAFLAIKNTDSLGRGNTTPQQEDYVQQAKDVVDQINQTQLQGRQAP